MTDDLKVAADEARPAFNDTLSDILDRVSYRRVADAELSDPVYRLRYEAYRREAFIPENPLVRAIDEFDLSPNVHTFGVYIDDRLVSSVRFHYVTPEQPQSPGRSVWPEVLDPVLQEGKTYIDPSRFTTDHEASLAYPALPFLTLRAVVMATDHFGVDYCLSAVRREHAGFYMRVFRSHRVGAERNFAELSFPMYLYITHVPTNLPHVYRRYPIFRSTAEERRALFEGKGTYKSGRRIAATVRAAQRETAELT
jgi:hypothetical protein